MNSAAVPPWALTLAFWLHMAATIIWIGGLFFQAVVLTPVLSKTTAPEVWQPLLRQFRRRFQPLAWMSLAVLVATGLVQMEASPFYQGFLVISNRWADAILAKHMVILLMVGAAVYQTWFVQPQLERAYLLSAHSSALGGNTGQLQARLAQLTRLNLVLGLAVLALTALARTA